MSELLWFVHNSIENFFRRFGLWQRPLLYLTNLLLIIFNFLLKLSNCLGRFLILFLENLRSED